MRHGKLSVVGPMQVIDARLYSSHSLNQTLAGGPEVELFQREV